MLFARSCRGQNFPFIWQGIRVGEQEIDDIRRLARSSQGWGGLDDILPSSDELGDPDSLGLYARRIEDRSSSQNISAHQLVGRCLPIPILLSLWPGPVTFIVRSSTGTLGCRVPADRFLQSILCETGPLYSTSVNFADQPSLARISDITEHFGEKVKVVIDGGDLAGRSPSSILDISVTPYRILRDGGAVLSKEIRELCR